MAIWSIAKKPSKGAGKAYALLREALAKSGKVGVAQFVLRNRKSLCLLKAQGNALTLNTLRFASEIRCSGFFLWAAACETEAPKKRARRQVERFINPSSKESNAAGEPLPGMANSAELSFP